MALAGALRHPDATAYDRKTDDDVLRPAILADYATCAVAPASTLEEALTDATAVVSLVTADQAAIVARQAAPFLAQSAWWFDLNSVAPDTKRDSARVIGPHYVDVAVMAPVLPAREAVPLLVSGDRAEDAAALLRALGFATVTTMAGGVGAASAVKMIRSIMVKGIEALSAECVLAAEAAGVRDAVIASLDASWPDARWAHRFDYNLDRMMVHGERRAAEMEEVVRTLDALGTGAPLARATVERQRAIGRLSLAPPDRLDAKLSALLPPARLSAKGPA